MCGLLRKQLFLVTSHDKSRIHASSRYCFSTVCPAADWPPAGESPVSASCSPVSASCVQDIQLEQCTLKTKLGEKNQFKSHLGDKLLVKQLWDI